MLKIKIVYSQQVVPKPKCNTVDDAYSKVTKSYWFHFGFVLKSAKAKQTFGKEKEMDEGQTKDEIIDPLMSQRVLG